MALLGWGLAWLGCVLTIVMFVTGNHRNETVPSLKASKMSIKVEICL